MTAPAGFSAPMTLAEARRWREQITSGALYVGEPHRTDLLAWLEREIAARVGEQEGADPDA